MKKLFLIGVLFFGICSAQELSDSTKISSNNEKFDSIMLALDNAIADLRESNNIYESKNLSDLEKSDLKGFNVRYDKFKKVNYIQAKSGWTDDFYPYIGLSDDGNVFLRMVIRYTGSDWTFFDKIHLIIDGEDYIYYVPETKRRVLSNASVVESADFPVDPEFMKILKAVSAAEDEILIRFSGERNRDSKIYLKEAEITTRILNLFEKLKI